MNNKAQCQQQTDNESTVPTLLTSNRSANCTCIQIDNGRASYCMLMHRLQILYLFFGHKSDLYVTDHNLHVVNVVKPGFCFHKALYCLNKDLAQILEASFEKHLWNTMQCYQPQVLSVHLSWL